MNKDNKNIMKLLESSKIETYSGRTIDLDPESKEAKTIHEINKLWRDHGFDIHPNYTDHVKQHHHSHLAKASGPNQVYPKSGLHADQFYDTRDGSRITERKSKALWKKYGGLSRAAVMTSSLATADSIPPVIELVSYISQSQGFDMLHFAIIPGALLPVWLRDRLGDRTSIHIQLEKDDWKERATDFVESAKAFIEYVVRSSAGDIVADMNI